MKYMLMIHDDQTAYATATKEQVSALYGGYMKFSEGLRQSGRYLQGNPLQPAITATTVRMSGGKRVATDGPYAEAKEQMGGYYLVNVADVDEAATIAETICKLHTWNSVAVEVRPVMEMGG